MCVCARAVLVWCVVCVYVFACLRVCKYAVCVCVCVVFECGVCVCVCVCGVV